MNQTRCQEHADRLHAVESILSDVRVGVARIEERQSTMVTSVEEIRQSVIRHRRKIPWKTIVAAVTAIGGSIAAAIGLGGKS